MSNKKDVKKNDETIILDDSNDNKIVFIIVASVVLVIGLIVGTLLVSNKKEDKKPSDDSNIINPLDQDEDEQEEQKEQEDNTQEESYEDYYEISTYVPPVDVKEPEIVEDDNMFYVSFIGDDGKEISKVVTDKLDSINYPELNKEGYKTLWKESKDGNHVTYTVYYEKIRAIVADNTTYNASYDGSMITFAGFKANIDENNKLILDRKDSIMFNLSRPDKMDNAVKARVTGLNPVTSDTPMVMALSLEEPNEEVNKENTDKDIYEVVNDMITISVNEGQNSYELTITWLDKDNKELSTETISVDITNVKFIKHDVTVPNIEDDTENESGVFNPEDDTVKPNYDLEFDSNQEKPEELNITVQGNVNYYENEFGSVSKETLDKYHNVLVLKFTAPTDLEVFDQLKVVNSLDKDNSNITISKEKNYFYIYLPIDKDTVDPTIEVKWSNDNPNLIYTINTKDILLEVNDSIKNTIVNPETDVIQSLTASKNGINIIDINGEVKNKDNKFEIVKGTTISTIFKALNDKNIKTIIVDGKPIVGAVADNSYTHELVLNDINSNNVIEVVYEDNSRLTYTYNLSEVSIVEKVTKPEESLKPEGKPEEGQGEVNPDKGTETDPQQDVNPEGGQDQENPNKGTETDPQPEVNPEGGQDQENPNKGNEPSDPEQGNQGGDGSSTPQGDAGSQVDGNTDGGANNGNNAPSLDNTDGGNPEIDTNLED